VIVFAGPVMADVIAAACRRDLDPKVIVTDPNRLRGYKGPDLLVYFTLGARRYDGALRQEWTDAFHRLIATGAEVVEL